MTIQRQIHARKNDAKNIARKKNILKTSPKPSTSNKKQIQQMMETKKAPPNLVQRTPAPKKHI